MNGGYLHFQVGAAVFLLLLYWILRRYPEIKARWLTGALSTVLAILSLFVFMLTYKAELDEQNASLSQKAEIVLSAVKAGISVHVRRGTQYMGERLSIYLNELSTNTDVEGIAFNAGSETVMTAGNLSHLAPPEEWTLADGGNDWGRTGNHATFYIDVTSFTTDHEVPVGRVPPNQRWSDLPPGPYRLAVLMNVERVLHANREARLQCLISWLLSLVAIVLGAMGFLSSQKRRSLETELAVTQERAAQQERLTHLSAGLAHETKNPLGVVRLLAQSIAGSEQSSPRSKGMARDIIDEVDRTVGQLNSFMTFARPAEPDLAIVELDAFFAQLLPLFNAEGDGKVEFTYENTGASVWADSEKLRRIYLNLAINAIQACPSGGQVTIRGTEDDATIALELRDTGVGVKPEDLPKLTQPYFSRFKRGTGLGLSIVDKMVRAHGWSLSFESEEGKSTTVRINGIRVATKHDEEERDRGRRG